jgi:hypothetical protein
VHLFGFIIRIVHQHLSTGLSYYVESTNMTVLLILYLCVKTESIKKQTGIQFRDKWACTISSNAGFYYPNDAT